MVGLGDSSKNVGDSSKISNFFVLFAFLSQVKESIQLLADNGNPYKPIMAVHFTRIVHPKVCHKKGYMAINNKKDNHN